MMLRSFVKMLKISGDSVQDIIATNIIVPLRLSLIIPSFRAIAPVAIIKLSLEESSVVAAIDFFHEKLSLKKIDGAIVTA